MITAEKIVEASEILSGFIYEHPGLVSDFLLVRGIITPAQAKGITLYDLNHYVLEHIEEPQFQSDFAVLLSSDGQSNFLFLIPAFVWVVSAIAGAVSATAAVGGAIHGGKMAAKSLSAQKMMGMMELEQNKRLAEEKLKEETNTRRKEILMNTLAQVRGAKEAAQINSGAQTTQMALIIGASAFIVLIFSVVIVKTKKTA